MIDPAKKMRVYMQTDHCKGGIPIPDHITAEWMNDLIIEDYIRELLMNGRRWEALAMAHLLPPKNYNVRFCGVSYSWISER